MRLGIPCSYCIFLITFSATVYLCQAQWLVGNVDDLKCKNQETHSDCKLFCYCGWCKEGGCFQWPYKSHKSHAYREALNLCNTTIRHDIKTRYYGWDCKFERGFWTTLAFGQLTAAVLLYLLIFLTGLAVVVLVIYALFARCFCRTGPLSIPPLPPQ